MDTNGIIQEHSKIKLELYVAYLELYLTVMLNAGSFSKVFIHDIFAGAGKSTNNENGSAVLGAKKTREIMNRFFGKSHVTLRLNEKETSNFALLQKEVLPFQSFCENYNLDANEYIRSWTNPQGSHNLFFIDPYGYTQIQHDNITRLYSFERSDYLVFVPIFHIYRFLRKDHSQQLKPIEQQLKPIATYLADLGIGEKDVVSVHSLEEFKELIIQALKKVAHTKFVYAETINNRSHNSQYALFFITRHLRGAEKFLEAQSKLKERITSQESQSSFEFMKPSEVSLLTKFIRNGESYDNIQLYELGIEKGLLPKQMNTALEQLEKEGKIHVDLLPLQKRKGRVFYIGYNYMQKNERKISVTFL